MAMRSILIPTVALIACAWSADAQQIATKVGIISIQGAIAGTKEGQKATQELEKKVVPKQKEFESRQSEITQLEDQYSKGGSVMAEDKRNQIARTIDEKKKRLERDIQDSEEDLRSEQQKMLEGLGQRMLPLIEKYAKDNGYTLVLDVSAPSTPVLYAATSINITQDIVALYDALPASAETPAPKALIPAPASKPPGARR
jgi:outer membrane protein